MDIAAFIVSVVALVATGVFSVRADRRAGRAEDQAAASAGDAATAAEESRQTSQRHADAAAETARQQALTNEAMQAMVEEMRKRREQPGQQPTASALRTDPPTPKFVIDKRRGQSYVLRNVGTGPASGVTMTTTHPTMLTRTLPDNETLEPGQGHTFILAGSMQAPLPTEASLTWSGHPAPEYLPIPP